jgi:hypothetical protein
MIKLKHFILSLSMLVLLTFSYQASAQVTAGCVAKHKVHRNLTWLAQGVPGVVEFEALTKCVVSAANSRSSRFPYDPCKCYVAACSPVTVSGGLTTGPALLELISTILRDFNSNTHCD